VTDRCGAKITESRDDIEEVSSKVSDKAFLTKIKNPKLYK
jgi:hypothetical protein